MILHLTDKCLRFLELIVQGQTVLFYAQSKNNKILCCFSESVEIKNFHWTSNQQCHRNLESIPSDLPIQYQNGSQT